MAVPGPVAATAAATPGRLAAAWRSLDCEALAFDVTGLLFAGLLHELVAGQRAFVAGMPPVLALPLVFAAFGLVLARLMGLLMLAERRQLEGLRLVVRGSLALLAFVQPLALTGMLLYLGILPAAVPAALATALGFAFLFSAIYGADEPKGIDGSSFGFGVFVCVIFFGRGNWTFESTFFVALAVDALLLAAWYLVRRRGIRVPGYSHFPETVPFRPALLRLARATAVALLFWTWWELVELALAAGTRTPGERVLFMYFSGVLLFRITLLARPPVNLIQAVAGLAVLVLTVFR